MTAREIIYSVRERLKLNSDDIDFSDEYLLYLLNVERTFITKQRFSKFTRNIPEETKQTICISLSPTSDVEDICDTGQILKSTVRIPASLEIGGRPAIIAIRGKQIRGKFLNIIPVERLPHIGYNKWLKNQTYIALDADGYLYLYKSGDLSHLEEIKVTGVFSNPEEAYNLECTKEEKCDFLDVNYPIEPYIISEVTELMISKLAPTLNIPDDKQNNSDESNRQ